MYIFLLTYFHIFMIDVIFVIESLLFYYCFMYEPDIIEDRIGSDGMRKISVVPDSCVCSVQIDIEIVGNIVNKVVYTRGCNGNAKGLNALIQGMDVHEAIRRLDGITCGGKPTSCPDQLARALRQIVNRVPDNG